MTLNKIYGITRDTTVDATPDIKTQRILAVSVSISEDEFGWWRRPLPCIHEPQHGYLIRVVVTVSEICGPTRNTMIDVTTDIQIRRIMTVNSNISEN